MQDSAPTIIEKDLQVSPYLETTTSLSIPSHYLFTDYPAILRWGLWTNDIVLK
jgi:hypothetical protein